MNRADRRMLSRPGKGEQFAHELVKIAARDANLAATTNTLIIMAEVLHEKFGFGRERIKTAWKECSKVAQCVNGKHVAIRDIRDTLADELKWDDLKDVKVGGK